MPSFDDQKIIHCLTIHLDNFVQQNIIIVQ